MTVGAFDEKGRRIADAALTFGAGETTATGSMQVPFELRNDFNSIAIDGENHAAAVRVLDESAKRRRVGLLSQEDADQAQPLLSPLYYIRRALAPYADLIEPTNADLAEASPQLLAQNPAMIVMADVGTIPESARQKLVEWLHKGGTLVRFQFDVEALGRLALHPLPRAEEQVLAVGRELDPVREVAGAGDLGRLAPDDL